MAFNRPPSALGVAELVSVDGRVLSEATIQWKNASISEATSGRDGLARTFGCRRSCRRPRRSALRRGREFDTFLYVTVGTGISASFVLNGTPTPVPAGLPGTFASSHGLIPGDDGHLVSGPPLEQFAAGPALAARFAAARPGFSGDTRRRHRIGRGRRLAAHERSSIRRARAVGAAIAQMVNMLDPEAVVIGGGLGIGRRVLPHVARVGDARSYLVRISSRPCRFVRPNWATMRASSAPRSRRLIVRSSAELDTCCGPSCFPITKP